MPFKAAIVTQLSSFRLSDNFSQIGEVANPDFTSLKSAPALKVLPWPVKIMPLAELAFSIKDKLVFVDVYVDPNEHVYPMLVAPNGSLKNMWISKGNKT